MNPQITGWVTAGVISVCPPASVTLISFAAALSCWKIVMTCAAVECMGISSVARNHLGVPPAAAISFALTFIAYQPMSSVAKVIGSDLAMRVFGPKSMRAASSPTPGPTSSRGSWRSALMSRRSSASMAFGSLPDLSVVKSEIPWCCVARLVAAAVAYSSVSAGSSGSG